MTIVATARPVRTRERILAEAADLFAVRGYGATSTRDISAAVGIRQPSLFHHFGSKGAILLELLDRSLDDAVPLAQRCARGSGPAGPRLYRYLLEDFTSVLTSPWNLGGVYSDEVLRDPEFAVPAARLGELDAALRTMLEQGVEGGEFRPVDAELVQTMIAGLQIGLMRERPSLVRNAPLAAAQQAAEFVLHGLLAQPGALAGYAHSGPGAARLNP